MVVVEAAYAMGPLSGFRLFRRHDDDDDSSGWRRELCLAQGCTFQWGLTSMVPFTVRGRERERRKTLR